MAFESVRALSRPEGFLYNFVHAVFAPNKLDGGSCTINASSDACFSHLGFANVFLRMKSCSGQSNTSASLVRRRTPFSFSERLREKYQIQGARMYKNACKLQATSMDSAHHAMPNYAFVNTASHRMVDECPVPGPQRAMG